MQLPKMVWEKEKVLMPDGRYLLFYNFNPITKDQIGSDPKSTLVKKGKGDKSV
jgi:hypothetical protein